MNDNKETLRKALYTDTRAILTKQLVNRETAVHYQYSNYDKRKIIYPPKSVAPTLVLSLYTLQRS